MQAKHRYLPALIELTVFPFAPALLPSDHAINWSVPLLLSLLVVCLPLGYCGEVGGGTERKVSRCEGERKQVSYPGGLTTVQTYFYFSDSFQVVILQIFSKDGSIQMI